MSLPAVPHLSVALAAEAISVDHVAIAEEFGLNLWLAGGDGGPDSSAGGGDSGLTALAAMAVARTAHGRLGLILALDAERELLRIAEDLGVLDQASGGRLRLAVTVPGEGRGERPAEDLAGLQRLVRSWRTWSWDGSDPVSVTPAPMQPDLCTYALPRDRVPLEGLDAGRVMSRVLVDGALGAPAVVGSGPLFVTWDGLWEALGSEEAMIDYVRRLRAGAARSGSAEVVLEAGVDPEIEVPDVVRAAAAVCVPGLRCAPDRIEIVVSDAMRWWEAR